jgi:hypothetical protein
MDIRLLSGVLDFTSAMMWLIPREDFIAFTTVKFQDFTAPHILFLVQVASCSDPISAKVLF